MSAQTYTVKGMTCDHCARSVTAEVSAIPGVTSVEVSLATGSLSITGEQPVADDQVRDAVEEAGYTLAS